eukprot:s180_g38.t1
MTSRVALYIKLGNPAITNLPLKPSTLISPSPCCGPKVHGIMLQISETRVGSSAAALHPALWQIKGGEQDIQSGVVSFEDRQRNAMVVTDLSASRLRFEVFDAADALASAVPWAFAEISPEDLSRKEKWSLLLSHTDSMEAVYGAPPRDAAPADVRRPAFLHLEVTSAGRAAKDAGPASAASAEADTQRRKKVMLITRGTRGDVQPFVALARGLALHCNCEAVVVTELRWKDFVKKNGLDRDAGGDLPARIRFRPSGGDTTLKVKTRGARLAMTIGQHSDTLQALMLSRSEVEFFSSEGCCYYWAQQEQPDFIVFGFTLTHIAMIISESLGIPIVGFTLQPTREIERREWNVRMLGDALEPLAAAVNGVEFQAFLQQAMERIPSPNTLNSLRISRGLLPCPADIDTKDRQTAELLRHKICKVVPISRELLPDQEVEGIKLTNFIFLRENPSQSARDLLSEVATFIKKAKAEGKAVVAMTFSSMPVGKKKMLQVAVELAKQNVACIVLAAGQPEEDLAQQDKEKIKQFEEQGLMKVLDGPVPFCDLFPEVDAAILHGGLGVTSEAMKAGIPVITSGILLMDQRFWAARLHEKKCGSKAIPVDALATNISASGLLTCLLPADKVVRQATTWTHRVSQEVTAGLFNAPEENVPWYEHARKMQQKILDKDDPDGLKANAVAVLEAAARGGIVERAYENYSAGCGVRCICRQGWCTCVWVRKTITWLLCIQLYSCVAMWCKCARWCVCFPARCIRAFLLLRGTNDHWDPDEAVRNTTLLNREASATHLSVAV